jgi:hypothetical protein
MVRVCEILDLDEIPDILFLEYSDGECKAKLYELGRLPDSNPPYMIEKVNPDSVCSLTNEFMGRGDSFYPDTVGYDRKSIYDSVTHRRVLNMRMVFPVCLMQVSYEDENSSLVFSDVAEGSLRSRFKVEEPSKEN